MSGEAGARSERGFHGRWRAHLDPHQRSARARQRLGLARRDEPLVVLHGGGAGPTCLFKWKGASNAQDLGFRMESSSCSSSSAPQLWCSMSAVPHATAELIGSSGRGERVRVDGASKTKGGGGDVLTVGLTSTQTAGS